MLALEYKRLRSPVDREIIVRVSKGCFFRFAQCVLKISDVAVDKCKLIARLVQAGI
jgi:hypothetical protein